MSNFKIKSILLVKAAASAFSDDLSLFNFLAQLHLDFRVVSVNSIVVISVIENQNFTNSWQSSNKSNDSAENRMNWRSHRSGNHNSLVAQDIRRVRLH